MKWLNGVLIALAITICGTAKAQVDQQNIADIESTYGASAGFNVGQSFIPTLDRVNYITLFADSDLSTPSQTSISLFSGSGFAGTNLGTSNTLDITQSGSKAYVFTFSNAISLTPGGTYTFRVNTFSGSALFEATSNAYSGGSIYSQDTPDVDSDLRFIEGIQAAAPEPGTWALMILGFGIVGYALRTRQRRVGYGRTNARLTHGPMLT